MRALVLMLTLALAACGAPQGAVTPDGGTCDGSLPVSCDGRCVWRCVEGQWRTDSPCQPCACFDSWCSRFGP